MTIHLFAPKFRVKECLDQVGQCLEKGWTGLGFKTLEIELAWSKYTSFSYSHFINSCTSGLHLAMHLFKTKYGWRDGDEVITTPLTFVSTNHAIKYCNLKPVFADIDEYLCLDPESIKQRLTSRTKAVVFVGVGGNVGQYESVVKICKQHGLILILDAAHMAGTRIGGKQAGLSADCSVFSFQAVKNMPTADSGMICFRNKEDDERVRKLSWLGINKDTYSRSESQEAYKWMYDVEEIGFKYHGNSIMASIALVSLKYLEQDNAYRRKLAEWYLEEFSKVDDVVVVKMNPSCVSSRHLFQIIVERRDELMLYLNKKNISLGVHYRDNTLYSAYSYADGTCPRARKASNSLMSLPMHMGITQSDVRHIVNEIKSFFNVKK